MITNTAKVAQVAFAPLVGALWAFTGMAIVPIITRILFTLGVGFVTFTGFSLLFTEVQSYVTGSFVGMPANMTAMLALTRIDDGAALVLSAISIPITWKMFQGSMKVLRFTGGS